MTQDTKALAKVSNAQQAIDEVQVDPRLVMAAKAIQLMAGQDDNGNPKVSADMALAAAMYQAGTGQLLGRDFYVNEKIGRMEGYRGVSRDAVDRGVGEVQIKYRPLTSGEAEDHEIAAGDTAVACEVYQLRAWRLAQSMGQRYEPIVGIGVIRKIEKYEKKSTQRWDEGARRYVQLPENQWRLLSLEGGMTWRKKAQNRAYKEALRHVPGGLDSAAEILEEAALRGVPQPPETARLTVEQAQEWVRLNSDDSPDWNEIEKITSVPEGARIVYDGPHAHLEPDPDFVPPTTVKPAPKPAPDVTDAEFESLPSASAERAAGNGKSTAPKSKYTTNKPWQNWDGKSDAIEWAESLGCDHFHATGIWTKVQSEGKINSKDMPEPFYNAVVERIAAGKIIPKTKATEPTQAELDAQAAAEEQA